MLLEDEVQELRERIAKLERKVDFLLDKLALAYEDEPPPVSAEILDLLRRGRKIEAIKRYREKTGATLRAAKKFVESLQ
jgi:ribosomal protein L7/L12